MLYDVRTYTVVPGKLKQQLDLYYEYGYEVQTRHLGKPFAYLVPETGNVNSFTHIWAYENAADREQKRAAMKADPDWIAYVARSNEAGYYQQQVNCLMNNAWFMEA